MILYFLFYFILPSCIAGDDKNGGVICAACGVVGAWVEEYGFTIVHRLWTIYYGSCTMDHILWIIDYCP